MERELLRKVQLAQLEIAKEIRRVCRENEIGYFLCCGTLLGAVRHRGFIPWDDDLDLGMLRSDYEKFCRIAPEKLGERFCLQSWYTDDKYALPFAKVRMRGTEFLEAKSTILRENGFFVDIFPFDNAPAEESAQSAHAGKLGSMFRMKLMKCGWKPWMDGDKINWKKRLGYGLYQLKALPVSSRAISEQYDALAASPEQSGLLCRQRGLFKLECYERRWYESCVEIPFEGEAFRVPENYDAVLRTQFGDYMTLPPEGERENRHQIVKVDFGNGVTWEEER